MSAIYVRKSDFLKNYCMVYLLFHERSVFYRLFSETFAVGSLEVAFLRNSLTPSQGL
jgi:hypothetical protein